MKFDFIQKQYIPDPYSKEAEFIGVVLGWQVTIDGEGAARGEVKLMGQEYTHFKESKEEVETIIEEKVKKLLEFDTRRLDEFEIRKYEEKAEKQEADLKELKDQNLELALMLSNGGAA